MAAWEREEDENAGYSGGIITDGPLTARDHAELLAGLEQLMDEWRLPGAIVWRMDEYHFQIEIAGPLTVEQYGAVHGWLDDEMNMIEGEQSEGVSLSQQRTSKQRGALRPSSCHQGMGDREGIRLDARLHLTGVSL
jgi:hypothetical protein